jgi:hypothetical protein
LSLKTLFTSRSQFRRLSCRRRSVFGQLFAYSARYDPRKGLALVMSWFRVSGGRLTYRGRITREPLAAWFGTTEGIAAIDRLASQMRFKLFGRARAARRQIWRELNTAARSEVLSDAIQKEAGQFIKAMTEMSYPSGLPRVQVALRRLVIVPRSLVAGRAREGMRRRLVPLLPDVDDLVKSFFCEQLLMEMDRAIEQVRPSPSRPVPALEEWSCVGADRQYVWVDPMWSGPGWLGHILMYEIPPGGLARRDRKELEKAIKEMQARVTSLSRLEREGVVRMATRQ